MTVDMTPPNRLVRRTKRFLARSVERAVGGDLDGDLGVLDVFLPEVLGDDVGELVGGETSGADRSDQGDGHGS